MYGWLKLPVLNTNLHHQLATDFVLEKGKMLLFQSIIPISWSLDTTPILYLIRSKTPSAQLSFNISSGWDK